MKHEPNKSSHAYIPVHVLPVSNSDLLGSIPGQFHTVCQSVQTNFAKSVVGVKMNTTLNCLALLVLIGSLVEIVAVDLAAGQAVDVDTSPFRMSRNLRRTYQAISECPRSARKLRRLCNQSCISKSSPDCIEWKEKLFKCCKRRECTCEDQNQLDPALPESSLEPSSAPSKAPSVGGPSTGGVDPEPGVDGPSTGGVDPEPSTELPDLNGWWEKNKPCGIVSCP